MPDKQGASRVTVKPENLFLVAYVPAPGMAVVNRLAIGETPHTALLSIRAENGSAEILHTTSFAVMVAAVEVVKRMAQEQGIDIVS